MKDFLGKIIFLIHSVIVVFWLFLLVVPADWWPDKISFHFYLTLFIVFNQFLWGLIIMPWTKKYRMVCFLTTMHQLLRGKSISDEGNYDHSFTRELFGNFHVSLSHKFITFFTLTVFVIVSLQYFLSIYRP